MLRLAVERAAQTDPLVRFLFRGSLVAILARTAGLVLSYVAAVLLSHVLGAEGYGAYSIALAWALLLVVPSRAGLDNAALKFATIYVDGARHGQLRGFLYFSALVICGSSLVTGSIVYFLVHDGTTGALRAAAVPAALLILPLAALGLVGAALRAGRHIFASQFYEQILRPVILISCLLTALALSRGLTPANALMLTATSALVALVFGVVHVWRTLPLRHSAADFSHWRAWAWLGGPLLLTAIIQEALNQIDVVMLGFLASPKDAGLFAAAWRIAAIVSFGVAVLTGISGPLIASLYEERDWNRLARIARAAGQVGFVVAVAICVPLAFAGRWILSLFGAEFSAAYPALLILLLGGLANAFTGSVAYLMTMTGRHLHATWIFGGALILSVVLNLLLIPRFGVTGAAGASSAGLAAWNLAMLVYVRRTIGIDASALALSPHVTVTKR